MAKKVETPIESDGLKFWRTELEHFKSIEKKIIEIGGRSMVIIGANGTGKSTLIQALTSALDVKLRPSKPIKQGETHASISTTLKGSINGELREYIVDLYFSPKNDSGRLVVTDADGGKIANPAGFLKGLIGNISEDVTAWMEAPKAKRLEKIKELSGCGKEVDLINISIKDKKELKSKKKERFEEIEAILKNHTYTQEEIDIYSKPVGLSGLQTEMSTISASQDKFDAALQKIKDIKKSISNNDEAVVKATEEINRLKALISVEENKISHANSTNVDLIVKSQAADKWLETAVRPSSAEISQRMVDANVHNEKCNQISTLANQSKEMMKFKDDVMVIDTEIKKLEMERNNKIKNSQLPIEGLSYDNDNVYLNGIPLEDGSTNTALNMEVSIDMAIYQAQKSNLKVIFIKDASMLDKNSLKRVTEKIEKAGMQMIAEVVNFEGGELEVRFTEEAL